MSTNIKDWNLVTKRQSTSPKLSNRIITFPRNEGNVQKTSGHGDNYQYEHIRKLNERLAYLQSENSKHNEILQQHVRYYTGELEKLQDELSDSRRKIHDMEEKFEEKTLEVDTFRKEKHRLTVEINELVSNLEQRDRHIQTLENSGHGWKGKYEELEGEYRNYKRITQQEKMENKRDAEEVNRRFQIGIDEKNRVLHQREELELALETLKKQHSDVIEVLNDYKEQVEHKNIEIQQRQHSAMGERESLEMQLTDGRREVELVRSDMVSLEQENVLLKDQLKLMKEHTRTIEKTSQENVRRLRLQLESETAKIQRLQARLESSTVGSSVLNSPPKKYTYKPPIIDPLPKAPNLSFKPSRKRREIPEPKRYQMPEKPPTREKQPIRKRISVGENHFNIGGTTKQKLGYFYPTKAPMVDVGEDSTNKIPVTASYKKRNYSQLQQFHVAANQEQTKRRQPKEVKSKRTRFETQKKKTPTPTPTPPAATTPNTSTSQIRSYKVAPKHNYENLEIQKKIAKKMIHGEKLAPKSRRGRKRYNMSRSLYDHSKEHLPPEQERFLREFEEMEKHQPQKPSVEQEILEFEKEQEQSRFSSQQAEKYSSLLDQMKSNRDDSPTSQQQQREEEDDGGDDGDDLRPGDEVKSNYMNVMNQRKRNSKWNQSSIRDLFRDDQITNENMKRTMKRRGPVVEMQQQISIIPTRRRAMEINPLDPTVDEVAKKEKMLLQTSEKITVVEPSETKENVDGFILKAQKLENDLMNLGLEKAELDGELQKIDHMSHRTARGIVRRREIEKRLRELHKEQSGIRTKLKHLGIFY